jgi:hypothetical protein
MHNRVGALAAHAPSPPLQFLPTAQLAVRPVRIASPAPAARLHFQQYKKCFFTIFAYMAVLFEQLAI